MPPNKCAKCENGGAAAALERNGARRLLVHVKAVHPILAFDRVWMIRPQHALPACEAFAQQPCSRLALVHVGQERREIVHGREGVWVARP